ncbi:LOW QUALITY PROTEIN: uncharacterized protein [Panulirus ornatus]|uniref:LOW QUALITY PROTEIN: uncharacterized protein n=1 Tax=Panulirus ornatus TaxID=150431 RepID=UPI003A85489D
MLLTLLTLVGSVAGTGVLWAVELASKNEEVANQVAEELGMVVAGKVFDDVFLFRRDSGRRHEKEEKVEEEPQMGLNHHLILWSERQIGRRRTSGSKRANPVVLDGGKSERSAKEVVDLVGVSYNLLQARDVGGLDRRPPKSPWNFLKTSDPLRWRQWYLDPGPGMHLNVTGLWASGVRGGGVSVAILDDGVELTHLDLALNYDPAASWDLLDADPDPTPVPWSRHGTQLAGIIAATHLNGLCGIGVAPWSGVGAVRMLGFQVWDVTEAAALSYERDHVDVYVAAWGPMDTGAVMEGPGVLASRAIRESIVLGRGGRGSIYVWASGNGGFVGDDCNADGYSNSIYTLTVSGSTRGGRPPNYAETCAATFVSTYSGDADEEIDAEEQVSGVVTTDTGGVCTESFRGSSVSAAMVAGAVALALDVNPRLRWRDVQHLMVRAATPHNPMPTQWMTNGVGLNYSHYFGFGSLDAGRMVDLAREWRSVPPAFRCHALAPHHNLTLVPDQTLVLSLSMSGCQVVQAEHIQVNMSVSAKNRGQVEISLESPSGTVSKLLPQRPLDLSPYGIHKHPFLTVHMWGEDPRGTWKLRVTYHGSSFIGPFGSKRLVETPNMLHNWTLIIHGMEVALDRATPYHHYYNSTQLSQLHNESTVESARVDIKRPRNPRRQKEERVRVETQYWSSPETKDGNVYSYLFCKVFAPVPSAVGSITWHTADGGDVENVVRRLRGKGYQANRHPALLLVREVKVTDGNFTCRAAYNNEVHSQDMEVWGNYSSVPTVTKTSQVSVEGGNVVLTCDTLAPILRGIWTLDGERVRSSPRVSLGENELTITGVGRQNLGEYRCHVRSSRLHYSHVASITLLLAQGPATLITHYAITSQPPPPPLPTLIPPRCTSKEDTTSDSENTTTSEPDRAVPISCSPPYEELGGHCLLVTQGERSWHRARTHCQRQGGDLLVLQDAALMLALIHHFHSQGFGNLSFWVGGLRRDAGEWLWVDDNPITLGEVVWYPTPSGRPWEIPQPRPPHHRHLTHLRRQGSQRQSLSNQRGRGGQGRERTGARQSSSPTVHRPRRAGSRLSRKRHVPTSTTIRPPSLSRTGRPSSGTSSSPSQIQSIFLRRPKAGDALSDTTQVPEETLLKTERRSTSSVSSHPISQLGTSPVSTTTENQISFSRGRPVEWQGQHEHQQEDAAFVSRSGKTRKQQASGRPASSARSRSGKARHQQENTTDIPGIQVTTGRPSSGEVEEEEKQREKHRGGVLLRPGAGQSQRAVCLWATLRHFFASCSVSQRLRAVCEYKAGT